VLVIITFLKYSVVHAFLTFVCIIHTNSPLVPKNMSF
jgi:hypothetical protein